MLQNLKGGETSSLTCEVPNYVRPSPRVNERIKGHPSKYRQFRHTQNMKMIDMQGKVRRRARIFQVKAKKYSVHFKGKYINQKDMLSHSES